MKVQLSCVGCGEPVCEAEPGDILAIACHCGAPAPILQGGGTFSPPLSLVRIVREARRKLPHLEYFLGYSDHESVVKTALIEELRERGAISQAECPEEECQKDYQRGRERWQRRRQEEEERELEEQERNYRILEIGEP